MKESDELKGIVYDIQRYSIHDGPGIRTVIFLKGCPLHCLWCSNPESQRFEPEYMKDSINSGQTLVGKEMTVTEVLREALRDRVFFEDSGGGITLSGGEPLVQPEFSAAIIEAAQSEGIHMVVSTTGWSPFETAWQVLKHADLILYDIKGMDSHKHKLDTGVENELILSNLKKLLQRGKEVIVRVPLIPEHNANIDNIKKLFCFAAENGVKTIKFLPYHRLGESKYERLSRKYVLRGVKTQSDEDIEQLLSQVSTPDGVDVSVG